MMKMWFILQIFHMKNLNDFGERLENINLKIIIFQ